MDFHLLYDSPCRDAGTDDGMSIPDDDYEGDPRTEDASIDIGADEFHKHFYYKGDATPEGKVRARLVDVPGSAPVGGAGRRAPRELCARLGATRQSVALRACRPP